MPKVTREFSSLAEFIDRAEAPTEYSGYKLSRGTDRAWTGTADFDEAVSLAFNWKRGAERIEKMAARIKPRNQKNRLEVQMKEAGPGVISMGHYNSGHPQPFVTLVDTNQVKNGRGKIVRIVASVSASGMVKASEIERRGAAVLSLVSALEKAGRRCEVVASFQTESGNSSVTYSVLVKRAAQKLNLYTIAFALAHPSMLRRFVFANMEGESAAICTAMNVGSGYGRPSNAPQDADVIYLQAMKGWEREWESDGGAEAWVRRQAEAQGVRF